MRKPALTLIIFLIASYMVSAQTTERGKISGKVTDEQQKPIEGATAELLRTKDSSLVKVAISNKSGVIEFENIRFGSYFIKTTYINHERSFSSIIDLSATNSAVTVNDIILKHAAKELQTVQVTGRKPFIQQMTDRIVVNVENSVIKTGIIIYIDGKPSPMSGADLVNYLRSLPSNAIERIELITNPSARYDAAGNAGIIDIRMKKDQRFGTNGSFTAGYGQGIYPKANTGINFNYRNKKVNLFGSYNFSYRMGLNHLLLDRNFYTDGQFTGQDLKDNFTKIPLYLNTVRFGADFYPNKKTVYGFVVNSNLNTFKPYNNNSSVVIGSNKQPLYTFNTQTKNNNENKNIATNFNFKHTFDSTGRELTADLDYAFFNTDNSSRVSTQYHNLDGTPMQPDYILDGFQEGNLKLATAKVDYVKPLKKKAKFETGFKTSFVTADNDALFFDMSSGSPVEDVNKTNHFFYDENINAAYFIFKKAYKKIDFQVGLRAENTNVKTRQVKGDIRWDSSYTQLFPSAYFNYSIKEDQRIGVSVSRRIDRPNYSQLNPFLFLIDVTTYA